MFLVHVLASSGIHNLAVLTGPVLAAAAKKSSSSFTLIFFVLLFGVGYMFLIRPQRQRRQRQLQLGKQISVGDKVMLSSGIVCRLSSLSMRLSSWFTLNRRSETLPAWAGTNVDGVRATRFVLTLGPLSKLPLSETCEDTALAKGCIGQLGTASWSHQSRSSCE